MALARDLSQAQLAFQIEGGEVDQFLVTRYRGTEGLCQLYRFEIELVSSEEAVAFEDIVGKAAVLSINTDWGQRWFHGIVSRFEMIGETTDQQYFRAELVPALWLLTHRYNSRIFQQKSTKDIITQVLTDAGITSDRFDVSLLEQEYPSREYCVQYRETDYNFICRLMEEEGIRWSFEQTTDGHKLILADTGEYAPIEEDPALPYHPPTHMEVSEAHVFRFRLGQSVRPGAVVLNDFNFQKPQLKLESKSDCGRDTALEFSDYPGEYIEQDVGQKIAQLRAEEFESGRIHGVGQSNCPRLAPGRTFDLEEHPSEPMNRSYMVTSVTHQGRESTQRTTIGGNGRAGVLDGRLQQSLLQARNAEDRTIRELAEALLQIDSRLRRGDPSAHRALTQWVYHAGQVSKDLPSTAAASGANPLEALSIPNLIDDVVRSGLVDLEAPVYECRFECILSETVYRPPRVTPWPVMRGSQTARVVGPKGEEIYTDEYGRVKVQFNWDREGEFDENSSCWIRVSQGLAGGQYGIMFLPRVGQEVVVSFLEGDPDQPLITGRVYNADQMPPYKLPDEKTKSVIKTHSSKGGGGTNEIRLEDLKGKEQILVYAQKDLHIRVNSDRVENVGNDRHLTVKKNRFELVKENAHSEVKLDRNEKVGGKLSVDVKGDIGQKAGGSCSLEAGGNIYLKAGKEAVIEATKALTLKVGGNFVMIDSSGVTILGTMVKINSGGAAGIGSAVALKAAEAPVDADSVEPGKDVTYTGGGELAVAEAPEDLAGHEVETSWIEVELVDEAGQPVVGEVVQVTGPDGEVICQRPTGTDGIVHVLVPTSGTCKISFLNLDAEAWEKA